MHHHRDYLQCGLIRLYTEHLHTHVHDGYCQLYPVEPYCRESSVVEIDRTPYEGWCIPVKHEEVIYQEEPIE